MDARVADLAATTTPTSGDLLYLARGSSDFGIDLANLYGKPLDIGLSVPKSARFTQVGAGVAPSTDTSYLAAVPSSSGINVFGFRAAVTGATTANNGVIGYSSTLASTASAYTLGAVVHYQALVTTKGAGSTITSVYGFQAWITSATGTNNYAFYTNYADASNSYAFYGAGTAESYFGGDVGVRVVPSSNTALTVGYPVTTATDAIGVFSSGSVPATNTSSYQAFSSFVTTAASVFSLGSLFMYAANALIVGAGSSIGTIYGFYVGTSLDSKSTNLYGFYSELATGYAFYAGGAAVSHFAGGASVGAATIVKTDTSLHVSPSSNITNVTGDSVLVTGSTAAATATIYAYRSRVTSATAAYTVTNVVHFMARGDTKGVGSTVTNAYGFWANSTLAIGTNNYAFYANVAAAANTWNIYIDGTAHVRLSGGGSVVLQSAALATSATDGFTYVPTCAGVPSGVPTSRTGTVALVFDTTNNRLYVYDGAWVMVALA